MAWGWGITQCGQAQCLLSATKRDVEEGAFK